MTNAFIGATLDLTSSSTGAKNLLKLAALQTSTSTMMTTTTVMMANNLIKKCRNFLSFLSHIIIHEWALKVRPPAWATFKKEYY